MSAGEGSAASMVALSSWSLLTASREGLPHKTRKHKTLYKPYKPNPKI